MKILIIGSKGFIGSHCVDYFSREHQVWQCDVIADYNTPQYYLIDATNADFEAIFSNEQFDVCINCSGAASVPDSIKNPHRDFSLNVVNVFKQLDSIRKHNPDCRYVNLSSAAVYGNPRYLPIDEQHPLDPISPYGCHKKMAEDICAEFYNKFSIKTASLRIFSAFGPRLQKQLFWDLHKKYILKGAINLFGTGEESRDYIYVTDVVAAINAVIERSDFQNDRVNVANGKEVYIKDAVRKFYEILGADIEFQFGGEIRKGDPINWVADISRLKEMKYSSSVDLDRGLKKYVEWLSENV